MKLGDVNVGDIIFRSDRPHQKRRVIAVETDAVIVEAWVSNRYDKPRRLDGVALKRFKLAKDTNAVR